MTTTQIGIKIGLQGAEGVTSGLAGVQNSLGSLAGRVETVRSALSGFAPALASAFTVGGLVAFVRNTANAIDAMNDLADATGSTIEEISKLDQVARRNGASLDSVGSMLVKFNSALKEADGKNRVSIALQAIGLEAAKLRQLDPSEALRQTAVALAGFADDGNKARIVQELFGKSVREAAPFLKDLAEAGTVTAKVTAEQAAEAEKFNKQLFALKANSTDAARGLLSDLLPALNATLEKAVELNKVGWFKMFGKELAAEYKNVKLILAGMKLEDLASALAKEPNNRGLQDAVKAARQDVDGLLKDSVAATQALKELVAVAPKPDGGAGRGFINPAFALKPPSLIDIAAEEARRKAAEEAAAALLKQQEAYDKLRVSIEERISAGQLELTQGQALTEAQRIKIKLDQDYASGLLKLTPAQKAVLDGKLADLAATEGQVKAEQDAIKAAKAAAEARADARRAEERAISEFQNAETARASASLASVKDRITSLQDEAKAADLVANLNISLAEALELVTIARLEEKKAQYQDGSEPYLAVQREIDARKELANLIGSSAAREANRRAADDAAREWQRTSDQIGQSLSDALMQGGKSAWEYIKGLFRTMVLRPVIQAIVNPIVGALGGSMGGPGAMGTLGGINSLASLGSAVTGGFTSSIANVLGTAGTVFGSSALTAFSAGMKGATLAPGLMGPTTAGASGAMGAGASVASAVPYVAAALAVANALGVFRSKSIVGGGLTGTLGMGDIQSYDLQRRGGTLFSGPDYSLVNRQTSTESAAIQSAFEALRTNAASMAEALGLSSSAVKTFTTTLGTDIVQNDIGVRGIKLDGLTPEQAAKKVEEALAAANEDLAAFVLGASRTVTESITTTVEDWAEGEQGSYLRGYLDQVNEVTRTIEATGPSFARTGETAVQTLQRLAGSIGTINPVLETLNLKLYDTSLAGADLASQLADAFGGLDAFTQATGTYYQEFFSEAERAADTTQQLTKALGGLGLALPTTRDQFRALVEAQDLSTESGRKAAATLIQLSGAFASITQEVSVLTGSFAKSALQEVAASIANMRAQVAAADQRVLQARQNIFDGYSGSLERLRSLLQQSAAATSAFSSSIQQVLDDLNISSALSPYDERTRFSMLQQQYSGTLNRARAGDEQAMGQLPALARQFLAAAQDLSETQVQYATYAAGVQQDLNALLEKAQKDQRDLQDSVRSIAPAALAEEPKLADLLAGALSDFQAFAQAVELSGAEQTTASDRVAQALNEYLVASGEQTTATVRLSTALAALEVLGLSESAIAALSAGITSAAGAFSQALGVSEETVRQLQNALGLDDEELAAAAERLQLKIDADVYKRLADSLGLSEATVKELATSLGVPATTLEALARALGLGPDQASALSTILGLSEQERARLANALGVNSAATAALATAVGINPAALASLQAAIGLSQASAATIAGLPSIIDFSDSALTQIERLAQALGVQPDVLQTLAQAVALKPEVLPALADALGLSDEQLSDLGLALGYSATTADALAESLGLSSGLTQELSQALGLSDATIETIRTLSSAMNKSLVTDGLRSTIRDVAASGTEAEKVSLYRMLRLIGLDDATIRATVTTEVGRQSDDQWAYLRRQAGFASFASGGMHQGGWRVVGEAGPELAYTGPERIFSNAQSRSLMDTSRLEAQMAALQAELALLRAETRATAVNTAKTADLIERATDGGSDYVRVVVDETIV